MTRNRKENKAINNNKNDKRRIMKINIRREDKVDSNNNDKAKNDKR